jgi:hypothetical protein
LLEERFVRQTDDPVFRGTRQGKIRMVMRFLFAAVVLSLGVAACSRSEVTSNSSGPTTASTQLNWDQGNWNQTNWQ